GRVSTGMHFGEFDVDAAAPGNLITSRILWLRGLEPGVNAGLNAEGDTVDTYERYIYIHGTNHEDKLGTPQSAGCVLMGNLDIIALYDEVRVGDQVLIAD
ncbi:MAG: L,D-transpeptidase, partial [Verrucomicrobiota bacterium]